MSGEPSACPACGGLAILATVQRGYRVGCNRDEDASCVIGPVRATVEQALAAWSVIAWPTRAPRRREERPADELAPGDRVTGPEGRLGRMVSVDENYLEVRWDASSWATYTYERAGAYRLRRVDEDAER
jgi:preprotein translocase subunit YajC